MVYVVVVCTCCSKSCTCSASLFFLIINLLSEVSNSHAVFTARRHCSHASFLAWRLSLCDRLHRGHLLELICSDLDYIHTGLLQNILKYLKGICSVLLKA